MALWTLLLACLASGYWLYHYRQQAQAGLDGLKAPYQQEASASSGVVRPEVQGQPAYRPASDFSDQYKSDTLEIEKLAATAESRTWQWNWEAYEQLGLASPTKSYDDELEVVQAETLAGIIERYGLPHEYTDFGDRQTKEGYNLILFYGANLDDEATLMDPSQVKLFFTNYEGDYYLIEKRYHDPQSGPYQVVPDQRDIMAFTLANFKALQADAALRPGKAMSYQDVLAKFGMPTSNTFMDGYHTQGTPFAMLMSDYFIELHDKVLVDIELVFQLAEDGVYRLSSKSATSLRDWDD